MLSERKRQDEDDEAQARAIRNARDSDFSTISIDSPRKHCRTPERQGRLDAERNRIHADQAGPSSPFSPSCGKSYGNNRESRDENMSPLATVNHTSDSAKIHTHEKIAGLNQVLQRVSVPLQGKDMKERREAMLAASRERRAKGTRNKTEHEALVSVEEKLANAERSERTEALVQRHSTEATQSTGVKKGIPEESLNEDIRHNVMSQKCGRGCKPNGCQVQ